VTTNTTRQVQTRASSPTAVQLVPESRIQGSQEAVGAALRRYHAAGRLVEFTPPRPVPGRPGEVYINVRLLPAAQQQPRRRRRGPYILAAVGLTLAAALAWMVYVAVAWIVAHIAIALVVLAGVAVLTAVGGRHACTTVITITHRH
jgi:hypothetical protein